MYSSWEGGVISVVVPPEPTAKDKLLSSAVVLPCCYLALLALCLPMTAANKEDITVRVFQMQITKFLEI